MKETQKSLSNPLYIDVDDLDNKDIHKLLSQYHKTKDKSIRDKSQLFLNFL